MAEITKPGYVANVASLAESTGTFVFPNDAELVSSIPLWMKFYCFEYSNTALNRVASYIRSQNLGSVPTLSNMKAQILLPAPTAFESLTALQYNRVSNSSNSAFPSIINGMIDQISSSSNIWVKTLVKTITDTRNSIEQAINLIGTGIGQNFGYGQDIPLDTTDLQFVGTGSYRAFDIRLYLPCLSVEDSVKAGKIIRSFEALSLPTATSLLGVATKYFHPPLWIFGVGPVDSMRFDPDWTGYPQLSILQSIKVRKTALDSNSVSAFYSDSTFKPVAYSISLLFRELEPAIRVVGIADEVGTTITNRSGAIIGSGTNIAARVTGT